MAEIGNVSVKFSASAGGLKSVTTDAAKALEAFGKAATKSREALSAGTAFEYASSLESISDKLATGAATAESFTATVTAGFSRMSSAISRGVSGQLTTLDKQLATGTISARQFAERLGALNATATGRTIEAFRGAVANVGIALDTGKISAQQFTDTIIQTSAAAAGSGIERLSSQINSIESAFNDGQMSAEEFTGSIVDLNQLAAGEAFTKQSTAVEALQRRFGEGRITAEEFRDSMENINTIFRMESIANYENSAVSLNKALQAGKISEEEFAAGLKEIDDTLEAAVIGDMREVLVLLEDQFGATSLEARRMAAQVRQAEDAITRAKERVAKAAAEGGQPFEGILSGIEKATGAAAVFGIEVPGVVDDVVTRLQGFTGITELLNGAIGMLGPRIAQMGARFIPVIGWAIAAGGAIYAIADYFGLVEEAQRLYSGKAIDDWNAEKRAIEERNAAMETGKKFQSQYGGRANEIRDEMARVREAMKYGGSMDKESGKAALEELNRQLEAADPKLRRMRETSMEFENAMKSAGKAAADVGNDRATAALARYRRDYRTLLKSQGEMPEIQFKAKLEGLAAAFDREMSKAKALQNIGEEIARISAGAVNKNTAAALNASFGRFQNAQANGAAKWDDVRVARLEGIKDLAGGMGLDLKAPEPTGIELYFKRLTELNAVVTKTAEEEALLKQARGAALKELTDERNKLLEGLPGSKADTSTPAERAISKFAEDMGKLQEAKQFINSPAAMLNPQDRMLAMESVRGRERNLAEQFARENEGVLDQAAAGRQPDRRANTAVLSNTSEGMAAYFRSIRGSDPVTAKQLREQQESRRILENIEKNTKNNGLAPANI
jgi:hypothetical protein